MSSKPEQSNKQSERDFAILNKWLDEKHKAQERVEPMTWWEWVELAIFGAVMVGALIYCHNHPELDKLITQG